MSTSSRRSSGPVLPALQRYNSTVMTSDASGFASSAPVSPRRRSVVRGGSIEKRTTTCLCSPTTHPGSFRCALHKKNRVIIGGSVGSPNRLNLMMRRSTAVMTNSPVRGEAGDLMMRLIALAALIRPSSHHQRRRAAFNPRPSRLSKGVYISD